MPSLFGRDGAVPGVEDGLRTFRRACVSAEFRAFAASESSPVITWLRALARLAHEACGGPGVGAIGMCFTGNFALTMMLEPSMLAPVLAQPTLPLDDPAGMHIAPDDLVLLGEEKEPVDLFILGSGQRMEMPAKSIRSMLTDICSNVEVMSTGAAVTTYNILLAEGRRVSVGLIAVEETR
jgi:uncharacterized protein